MNEEEARNKLKEVIYTINLINIARVFYALSIEEQNWGNFNNAYWVPNYNKVVDDVAWLTDNIDLIKEAVDVIKANKKIIRSGRQYKYNDSL